MTISYVSLIQSSRRFSCFFNRMQKMQAILLDKLKETLDILNSVTEDNQAISSSHTSLYAILVLLSNMVPSRLETPKEQQTIRAFVPLIQRY